MSAVTSIKLNIAEKLREPSYRSRFFRRTAQDAIAMQIRGLREKRVLKQKALAQKANMKQSAISRIEQADYEGWTFKTLFRIAGALDARLRVTFEPLEEVIAGYEQDALGQPASALEISCDIKVTVPGDLEYPADHVRDQSWGDYGKKADVETGNKLTTQTGHTGNTYEVYPGA